MLRNRLIFCAVATLFYVKYLAADVIDQFARQGRALIAEAAIQGSSIRQCSCVEQRECVDEMKSQALGCVDSCWNRFEEITSHPSELRKCFSRTDNLLEELITCFEHNVEAFSCLDEKADVMIQKVNITELFRLSVLQIQKTKIQLTKSLAGPIKKIVDTAGNFGLCVKDCFLGKNANGFCFDTKNCQPLLVDKKARKSLRQCTRLIDWKKEAGELCDCSVRAGLSDLDQYCPMLRLIGGGHRSPLTGGRK